MQCMNKIQCSFVLLVHVHVCTISTYMSSYFQIEKVVCKLRNYSVQQSGSRVLCVGFRNVISNGYEPQHCDLASHNYIAVLPSRTMQYQASFTFPHLCGYWCRMWTRVFGRVQRAMLNFTWSSCLRRLRWQGQRDKMERCNGRSHQNINCETRFPLFLPSSS